jgi:hypothetical protein
MDAEALNQSAELACLYYGATAIQLTASEGSIAMPYRVRIACRFRKQSAEQFITMARADITGLTGRRGHPSFFCSLKQWMSISFPDKNIIYNVHNCKGITKESNPKKN